MSPRDFEIAWMTYTVFATVRNPWKRAYSTYQHLLEEGAPVWADDWQYEPSLLRKAMPFGTWCKDPYAMQAQYGKQGRVYQRFQTVALKSQRDMLFTRQKYPVYDHLVRLETADHDFEALINRINAGRAPDEPELPVKPFPKAEVAMYNNKIKKMAGQYAVSGNAKQQYVCKDICESGCQNKTAFYYTQDAKLLGYQPPCNCSKTWGEIMEIPYKPEYNFTDCNSTDWNSTACNSTEFSATACNSTEFNVAGCNSTEFDFTAKEEGYFGPDHETVREYDGEGYGAEGTARTKSERKYGAGSAGGRKSGEKKKLGDWGVQKKYGSKPFGSSHEGYSLTHPASDGQTEPRTGYLPGEPGGSKARGEKKKKYGSTPFGIPEGKKKYHGGDSSDPLYELDERAETLDGQDMFEAGSGYLYMDPYAAEEYDFTDPVDEEVSGPAEESTDPYNPSKPKNGNRVFWDEN